MFFINLQITYMKKITFIALMLMISIVAFCQKNKKKQEPISNERKEKISDQEKVKKEEFEDVIREDEENKMTLRFIDAKTGDGVQNANIVIQDLGEFTTDMEGKVIFPLQTEDKIILCAFKCSGYISAVFKTEAIAGTLFYNRFSVSPVLKLGSIRIVLDWDAKPGDLDAHFIKNGPGSYHISFRNTKVASDGMAMLDRDDMDGFGPETITAMEISNDSEYEYFVHDYSNQYNRESDMLSASKIHILVYGNEKLMNEFRIAPQQNGVKWNVFKIVNGQVVPQGRIE